jgi:FKBP-type peptidyl-prolyl cis-trans isomerase SlyD
MGTIQPNSHVTLDYTLKDDEGAVLDASDAEDGSPIAYVHGYGMLVPGLEAALAGLAAGDEKDIVVPAAAGYGEYDDELVMEIDRTELPDPGKVQVGDELVAESEGGEEVPMEVLEVKADSVVVDANHPLAGLTLHYSVRIKSVREATASEIEEAATALDEAHDHVHGEGCDHDHSHDEHGGMLVTLGTNASKKRDLLN